jgi:hypothetical protein
MAQPDLVRPQGDALVKVNINGREYDAKYVASCHTCTHPARLAIEEALLGSHTYQQIAALYSGVQIEDADGEQFTTPEIGWGSIRNHYRNGHMPLEVAALRELADRRSAEMSASYNGTLERHVTRFQVAESILQKGYDNLVSGNMEVDAKDTLAAAKFLQEAEQGSQVDAEAWSQAMQVYFETVQRLMPPDMWKRFVAELSKNPILKALEQKLNADDGDVIDAEVVDP